MVRGSPVTVASHKNVCLFGFFQEINTILQHVVERNRVRRSLSAKRNALRSWRNLVETLLTACPADLLPADERQLIIRDLLLDLHDKVSGDIGYTIYKEEMAGEHLLVKLQKRDFITFVFHLKE